eukprot:1809239-Rhodomonas_salina.1
MFISHGPNTLCLMCHVPEVRNPSKRNITARLGLEEKCDLPERQRPRCRLQLLLRTYDARPLNVAELTRADNSPFLLPDGSKMDK